MFLKYISMQHKFCFSLFHSFWFQNPNKVFTFLISNEHQPRITKLGSRIIAISFQGFTEGFLKYMYIKNMSLISIFIWALDIFEVTFNSVTSYACAMPMSKDQEFDTKNVFFLIQVCKSQSLANCVRGRSQTKLILFCLF